MPAPVDQAAPVRVAVLGASGIGRFHVREFARAGAEVVAILGSTPESAACTASKLAREYADLGVNPKPLSSLDELFAEDLDAVTIATPNHLHQEATLRALLAGLFVFCEKPLFWNPGMSLADAHVLLADLYMAGARDRVCVNTSNASFVRTLRERGLIPRRPRKFEFHLMTVGEKEGKRVGIDLLPHALSLLYECAAPIQCSPHTKYDRMFIHCALSHMKARFRFKVVSDEPSDIETIFILGQYPGGPKSMTFTIDNHFFERIQRLDEDGRYRVYLRTADKQEHEVEDPFRAYIRDFLQAVCNRTAMPVCFDTSARILLDSIQLLRASRRS